MAYIEPIDITTAVSKQDTIVYVGFDEDEIRLLLLEHKARQFAGPFLGEYNSLLKIFTDTGDEYTVVFKALNDGFYRARHSFPPLLINDKLMLCANGRLYRYLINERKCISMTDYELPPTISAQHYALASDKCSIMIVATIDGLVAIRWEDEFWKQPFDWAYAGYLELQKIDNERLIVNYDCPDYEGQIALDLLTGQKLG